MLRGAPVRGPEALPLKRTDAAPKKPTTCCGIVWDWQSTTFVVSLVVQLLVLIFSLVTLFIGSPPPVLQTILILESVVQGVELLWYLGIAFRFAVLEIDTPVVYRYIDWAVTTPTMLISLFFLLIYFSDTCTTNKELRNYRSFVLYIILIAVFDLCMLACGVIYENNVKRVRERWWGGVIIALGFAFLVAAFFPHYDALSRNFTVEGIWTIVLTILLWAVYGVVAFVADDPKTRNAFYNILDVFSKNVAGLLVSILALNVGKDTCS